ncbi:Outer membrane efflux protein [Botrimarina colliarenosi]|uniref:Outer membrane efflux protein n=1 Tax=Botrimarina colliarenosi TaxID=2528001 RepID=A0A5C6AFH4_9BACT|nr:TolC family protein [Botrimarina colliarenosi]TWT97935.1 Outer membrane efflux protein [Botrimarina colliarenosi]
MAPPTVIEAQAAPPATAEVRLADFERPAEESPVKPLPLPLGEAEGVPTPRAQPALAQPLATQPQPLTPPTVNEVVRSVVEFFPLIEQAAAGRTIASGQVLEAWGAFDHKLEATSDAQPLDFYENYRSGVGVKRDTYWGGRTFAGYRIGRGVFEPWYLERETNKGGEFKAGFTAPLIRDRSIDANRSELWQAEIERTRIEAEIDAQVISSVRAGAGAYWEWVAAAQKLRIAEEVLSLGLDRKAFLERQVDLGEKAAIDLVDNRRIIVSREAKVTDARRKLQQSAAKLSLYLRTDTGRPWVLQEPGGEVPFGDPLSRDLTTEADDVELALSNRPELRELQLVNQQLRVAMAQASNETWPDVDAGLLVAQDVGEPTSSKRDKSEFELEASLTLSVPLERRKAYGKLRQLRGKVAQVRAKQRFTGDKIAIEIQSARAALEAAVLRVEQTAEGVELADRMKSAERRLYEEGQSTLFNLNIREQQAAESAAELVDAQRDYFLAEADLAAAMGLAQPSLGQPNRVPAAAPDLP